MLLLVDLAFNGLVFGCMYALMAVGLTLVYGLLRILHIAHAAVYALGAYVAVIVANGTGSIAVGIMARSGGRVTARHGDLSPAVSAVAQVSARTLR